ncbi:serine/threonine-protein kinase [Actinomadura sp. NPDC023710]|uniref:serine/threonine-protein kinase n=1 Tax=Actinomadura sp. NPDC023710 TaxID=3158219 RepID=UPI0033EDC8AD
MDADEAPRHGRRLGPYTLIRVLGTGGMGTVHLADDPSGRKVAIKVINRRLADQPKFRERFRREVSAASHVRPFCTAPVLDADLDGDPLYIVTEYIPGSSLEEAVSEGGPLGGADLEALAAGVATALTAIHSAGVVHRDLKPANIMLSPFGPRVIDFGIARKLDTDDRLTETGQSMGTPSFMAPEGLVGEPITPAADVFTWGCVVAFAGTGRPPFPGENVGEILYRTVHGQPDLDGLGSSLKNLVLRALAKNPAERPTAVRVLEELTGQSDPEHAAQSGIVSRTTSPDTPRRPERAGHRSARDGLTRVASLRRGWTGRRRWAVTVGAAAVLAAATAVPFLRGGDDAEAAPRAKGNVLTEDFDGGGSGWDVGTWPGYAGAVEDGRYVVSKTAMGGYRVVRAPSRERPRNLSVTASVHLRSTDPADEAGVFCRGDESTGYEVMLASTGAVLIRKGGADAGTLLARSPRRMGRPGRPERLRATCESTDGGVRVRAWIGERNAADVTDRPGLPPDGAFGLVTGREHREWGAPSTVAVFDDLVVDRI